MERLTFAATAELDGNTLSGRAYTYGQVTNDGRNHTFARGAFDKALQTSDTRAFLNHDRTLLLGRKSSGTLRLTATPEGLDYAIDLPDTSYARDAKVLIERGDLNEMSFGITEGQTRRERVGGKTLIVHTSVTDLFDISPVSVASFGGTSIQLHSAGSGESRRGQAILARHRALLARLK